MQQQQHTPQPSRVYETQQPREREILLDLIDDFLKDDMREVFKVCGVTYDK